MKKFLFLTVAFALLSAGCAQNTNNNTPTNESPTPETTAEEFIPQFPNTDKNGLVIAPQNKDKELSVKQYYLEKPGFIVIHDIEKDSPSTVLAQSNLLQVGLGNNLTIPTKLNSGVYFALLYADNGDGKFDVKTDKELPLYSDQSNSYSDRFVTQFIVN